MFINETCSHKHDEYGLLSFSYGLGHTHWKNWIFKYKNREIEIFSCKYCKLRLK